MSSTKPISEETIQRAAAGGFTPPTLDPLRGYYGIISATAMLEAISTALAGTVVMKFTHHAVIFVLVILALAGALVGICAVVKKPWFWWANSAIQVLIALCGYVHVGIAYMVGIFIIVWCYIVVVGKKVQQKITQGLLPGQQPLNH